MQPVQRAQHRAGELFTIVAAHIAGGAQDTRRRRHDDWKCANKLGQRIGMERPGATEGHQGEVARIVPTLYRHQAQGAVHVLVNNVKDALGRAVHI